MATQEVINLYKETLHEAHASLPSAAAFVLDDERNYCNWQFIEEDDDDDILRFIKDLRLAMEGKCLAYCEEEGGCWMCYEVEETS